MKKLIGLFLVGCLALVGCSQKEETQDDTIKVGVLTDLMGVDDKSFSEITWKGVSDLAVNLKMLRHNTLHLKMVNYQH